MWLIHRSPQRKREESVAAAKAAAELKEEMRPGGGSEAAGVRAVVGGGSGFTVICEAGADYKAVVDSGDAAAWVMVIHGKTRFRMLLGGAGEAFGGFKARLAVVSKVHAWRRGLEEIACHSAATHRWGAGARGHRVP